jgi:hypothetical protein
MAGRRAIAPPSDADIRNWRHLTVCRITLAHAPLSLTRLTAAVNDNAEEGRA